MEIFLEILLEIFLNVSCYTRTPIHNQSSTTPLWAPGFRQYAFTGFCWCCCVVVVCGFLSGAVLRAEQLGVNTRVFGFEPFSNLIIADSIREAVPFHESQCGTTS